MRENMLSRRTVVYAILLVAVFLLLALAVSGCTAIGGGIHSTHTRHGLIILTPAEWRANPKPHRMHEHGSTAPGTCTPLSRPAVKVAEKPLWGRIQTVPGHMVIKCNGSSVTIPATVVQYVPRKGFTGFDWFGVKAYHSDNRVLTHFTKVEVTRNGWLYPDD